MARKSSRCFTSVGSFVDNNSRARATVRPDARVVPLNLPRETGWKRPK